MRRFDDFHPTLVLLYYLTVLMPVMFFSNIICAATAWIAAYLRICISKRKISVKTILFSAGLVAVMGVVNAMVSHAGATELFFVNGKAITLEALRYGMVSGLMIAAVFLWFRIISDVITGEKITSVFRHMPKLGMIVSMIFRLVPMYAERYEKVSAANRINPDQKSGIKVMSAVFTNSLEGSVDMTLSMTDRGYDFRKTRYSRYSFGGRDVVFLCIIILFQGMYFGRGMGLAIVRSIYFMLPLICDGKECLKWLCMKNRIFQLNREN